MGDDREHQELAEAYRATTYVGMPQEDPEWRVRVDRKAPVAGPMAYITSDNPESCPLDEETNDRRRLDLKAELVAAGCDYIPGKSVADDGEWPEEHGFWVFEIDRADAVDLAERFGQNAILFVDRNSRVELVFCSPNEPGPPGIPPR